MRLPEAEGALRDIMILSQRNRLMAFCFDKNVFFDRLELCKGPVNACPG